jgi:hypothetical protein
MKTRITVKDLDRAVIELNTMLGYTMGQEGSFCLQGSYGGWQLQRHRAAYADGGIVTATPGFRPKRELYNHIISMMQGIQYAFDGAPIPN